MKVLSVITVFMLLVACGSSPSPVLPPVALTPLENKIKITRLWKFTAGEGVGEQFLKLKPVIKRNTGYVADYKGYIRAFNIKTKDKIWDKHLNTPVSGGLTYANGKLILGSSKGEVIVLRAKDGEILWRSQLSSEILSSPALAKGIVVAKTIDGRVYGLNAKNGKQRWVYDRSVPRLTLRGSSAPIISNDIVITASDSGKLSALILQNGKLLWETTIAVAKGRNELERVIDLDVDPVVYGDVIYTVGYQGRLAAVKIDSGQLIWSRDFSSYSGIYVDAYRVYITDSIGQVWALNRYNGSTLWRQDKLLRRQLTAPEAQDEYIVVGDFDGYIHWLNRENGKLIARYLMNSSFGILSEEESEQENELIYRKWNNILVTPFQSKNMLFSLDRLGNFEAYKIQK